jgi:hypothetical protein|tara:strand:+ start:770 stop:1054 length:285 start_codon:yes stop_codon:yes gene_type:complete
MKAFFKQIWAYLSKVIVLIWKGIKWCYIWLKYKLFPRYKLTVSYNSTWGDEDDRSYEVKKFIKKQPNFIKFINDDGELIEIRGADGLNYRVEEL